MDGMSLKDDICRHDALMQPRRVTHQCCIAASCQPLGELLTRAAFMHDDDKGHDALMHYAVLKGLYSALMCYALCCYDA